jgi:HSP20 family protein
LFLLLANDSDFGSYGLQDTLESVAYDLTFASIRADVPGKICGDNMAITRYYPWTQSHRFQDEMKQVFDRFFSDEEGDQSNVVTSQWTPRVDIKEEDKRFVILADIPGVEPGAIEVHMDNGILSIKGERKTESKDQAGKLTRIERSYGAFYRRFALPDTADAEGISAIGKNGVLEISIPKKAEAAPRRIEIKH